MIMSAVFAARYIFNLLSPKYIINAAGRKSSRKIYELKTTGKSSNYIIKPVY
jgi:hypothetical protein